MNIYLTMMLFACISLNAGDRFIKNHSPLDAFKAIPTEDQAEIRSLFKTLFVDDIFAYSLLSDKPISFSTNILYQDYWHGLLEVLGLDGYCQSVLEPYCEPESVMEKQWEIWENHKSKFNIKHFLFFKKRVGRYCNILIINKKSFKRIVDKNIRLFKKNIGEHITANGLLEEIKKEDCKSLFDNLNQHEGLLGILLGFGKHNSMLYHKRETLRESLGKVPRDPKFTLEEIHELDEKLQLLNKHDSYIISSINRIGFVADPEHPETVFLRKKYRKLTGKIARIYSGIDWFDFTLTRLSE